MNKNIIKQIVKSIEKSLKEDPKPIHFINGMYGSGKTAAIKSIVKELKENVLVDGIIIFQDQYNLEFLVDIAASFELMKLDNNSFRIVDLSEKDSEQKYNKKYFKELIDVLNEKDKELARHFTYYKKCKSIGEKFILDITDPEEDISSLIEEHISKKPEQRLLLQTEDVCSESLIVDLMNVFYPINDNEPSDMKSLMPIKPAKILVVINGHSSCNAVLYSWLFNSLFNYVFNKAFSEFINYDIVDNDDRIRVNQFFDFRFIITGRENTSISKLYPSLENYQERIKVHRLNKLSKKEVADFLTEKNIKIDTDISNLHSLSFGLPELVMLWSEYFLLDDVGDDTSVVYNKAATQILENKSAKEKEWIRCASFLDEFDSYGLRCFPEISKEYKIAYEYFAFFNELSVFSKDNASLQLHEEIREIISRSISSKSEKIFSEYQKIAETYKNARKLYCGLSIKEIEVFRNFAYFSKFEKKCILKEAYESDYELAIKFLNDHPDFFEIGKYSISLKSDIREKLDEFNKRIDLGKYAEKKEFVNKILEDFTRNIREDILAIDDRIQNLNREMKDIKVNINPKKSINESLQRQYIDKENERIEIKKKLSNLKYKSNLFSSLINLGFAILFFFIAFYLPDFYEGVGINRDSKTVETLVFITSGIFAVSSLIYSIRSLSSKMKKSDRKEAEERLQTIEREKANNHAEMKKLKQESTQLQNRLKEIEKELEVLKSEISDNRAKLSEDYA
jgi:hypothetical protein